MPQLRPRLFMKTVVSTENTDNVVTDDNPVIETKKTAFAVDLEDDLPFHPPRQSPSITQYVKLTQQEINAMYNTLNN